MPKYAGSGPGLVRLSQIRQQAQKIRLQNMVAARRDELASAKRQWRKVRREREAMERLFSSGNADWSSDGARQDCVTAHDDLVTRVNSWEQECRRCQGRLNEAIESLHTFFPPLWLEVWRWLKSLRIA